MEFRAMRRKRQQLSDEESIGILQKATAGTLALLGDNDYPYAVPISYVYHERKLYFTALWLATKLMPSGTATRLLSASSTRMMFSQRNTRPSSAA